MTRNKHRGYHDTNKASSMKRLVGYFATSLFLITSLSGCIFSPGDECYVDYGITIRVVDKDENDITANKEVGDVELYIFDKKQRYLETVIWTADQVKNKEPFMMSKHINDDVWVVAWANTNNMKVHELVPHVTTMKEAVIELLDDGGFARNPDDLFYGSISSKPHTYAAEGNNTLVIRRQMASLNIVVKGLILDPDADYTFTVKGSEHDSFDFTGWQVGPEVRYKRNGFIKNTLLVAELPYRMLPAKENNTYIVYIYKGAKLVSQTYLTENVAPEAGEVTNVFIDVSDPSSGIGLVIDIQVTNWAEYYQWAEW